MSQGEAPFRADAVAPMACLGEAVELLRGEYWLFVLICGLGLLVGSVVPLAILMGPMLCGIYYAFFMRMTGQAVRFEHLLRGLDYFLQAFIAALLQLAASMLLIVPIFLYVLFLEDLLRHKLTLQEAVVSTPWDFTGVDYEKLDGPVEDEVSHYARNMWCDHSSAYNSYDIDFECGNDDPNRHHKAVSAHVCWMVQEDGEGEKR